jgi:hypothetical protein
MLPPIHKPYLLVRFSVYYTEDQGCLLLRQARFQGISRDGNRNGPILQIKPLEHYFLKKQISNPLFTYKALLIQFGGKGIIVEGLYDRKVQEHFLVYFTEVTSYNSNDKY